MKSFDKTQDLRAVIFDMDGLLIDSETSAWSKAIYEFLLSKEILSGKKIEAAREKAKGAGHKETIEIFKENLGIKGNTKVLVMEMRDYFFKIFLQNPKLMQGAKTLLNNLRKNKYHLAVATGLGPRDKVINLLSELKIKTYFAEIITGDEIAKGKPNPEIYLKSSLSLGIDPCECLVLEDAVNGVLAGKRAEMEVFGVNKDEKIRESLKKAGADKVFSDLLKIKDC